jgi:D-3-phosphoglycerate dehydrogenase
MQIVPKPKYYVFDFDSTLTAVEAFEELAAIALKGNKDKDKIVKEIGHITDLGVDGTITFTESLERRILLLHAKREHLVVLVKKLKSKISKSIKSNKDFFLKNSENIYVISGGFKEFVDPIVAAYKIPSERVYANTFTFDKDDNIIGFDRNNHLAQPNGKIGQLKELNLDGEIYVIGDGYSDYQMREAGLAHKFFAYTENIERVNILDRADHITPSFDEFLYVNKLPMNISYPKNRIKVLLLENVHADALEIFKEEGYQVETHNGAMTEAELAEAIKGVSILGIRSKTQVTKEVLKNADRLLAIGAFCIGTNQIDLDEALKKGVAVFNAPYSNTRSVVELAIGEIIMLQRGITDKSKLLHEGKWDKSAKGSFEIRGKKLGIIGYGNIGSQLSVLAESLGMQVMYYDVVEKLSLGNAYKCGSLRELLKKADIITLHVDGSETNTNLIGENEFKMMKEGIIFLNLSRGHVVDITALEKYIKNGKIRGAGVDVYPYEPKTNDEEFKTELRGLPNTILTPHVGGSTEEAQRNIAAHVPENIIKYINTGNSFTSVNLPNLTLPELNKAHRLLHLHKNVPGIMAKINSVFARYGINILGQYLKTSGNIGYLITDIDKAYNEDVVREFKKIDHTIRFRVLY